MADVFARTYGVELLCRAVPSIAKPTLLRHLQALCPGVEPLDPESSLLGFVHPGHPVQLADARIAAQTFVAVSEKPLEASAFGAALDQTWDFEGARGAVAGSEAAVLVTDLMSSGLDHRERLGLFQRALRAVLASCEVSAIHWQRSGRIVDPAAWSKTFDGGDPAQLFMAGAMNVRMFNVQQSSGSRTGEVVMDTLGLGAFGLPDLQCHYRNLPPAEVARVLYNTSWYIFSEGDVIADGHTVQGAGPGSKWRCQHEDALVDPPRVVLDLDPGPPHAAGGRAG